MASSLLVHRLKSSNKDYHHKVRTGCVTCKRRRLKCDEAKPFCHRCSASSIQCEGYKVPPTWIFEGLGSNSNFSQGNNVTSILWNDGKDFLTLFPRSTREFWTKLAPQLACRSQTVYEAFLALCYQAEAVTEDTRALTINADGIPTSQKQAILHYDAAIRLLAVDKEIMHNPQWLITCCLLFSAIETIPREDMSPHLHLKGGIGLLQAADDSPMRFYEGMPLLRDSLFAMASDHAAFDDRLDSNILGQMNPDWTIPDYLEDSAQAIELVDDLIRHTSRCLIPPHKTPRNVEQLSELHARLTAAVKLTLANRKISLLAKADLQQLLIHLRTVQVMLHARLGSESENTYDNCKDSFQFIVNEAEKIISTCRPENGFNRLSLGLLAPLFAVATKCRSRTLRLRACELLHRCHRGERLWNSCIASIIARAVIDIETTTDRRIDLEAVSFRPQAGKMSLTYKYRDAQGVKILAAAERAWDPTLDSCADVLSISQKSLRVFGYSGRLLVCPPKTCRCLDVEAAPAAEPRRPRVFRVIIEDPSRKSRRARASSQPQRGTTPRARCSASPPTRQKYTP